MFWVCCFVGLLVFLLLLCFSCSLSIFLAGIPSPLDLRSQSLVGLTYTLPHPTSPCSCLKQSIQTGSASTCSTFPTLIDGNSILWFIRAKNLRICLFFFCITIRLSSEILLVLTLNYNQDSAISYPFYCKTGWATIISPLCYCNCLQLVSLLLILIDRLLFSTQCDSDPLHDSSPYFTKSKPMSLQWSSKDLPVYGLHDLSALHPTAILHTYLDSAMLAW